MQTSTEQTCLHIRVCDVDGDCDTATVTITINPVNDVPVAVNDTNTTNEDTPVSGTSQTNDTPSGDGGNVWTLVGVDGGASQWNSDNES
jgi:large repetitive protein